ncbi:MAG TPA: glycosyltransferase family 2 protein [Patescibacteria group bacterium]|nr:glycosyltransferase family 2 protein [Patescibacteria group bacterium]
MKQRTVSIVIPFYNERESLGELIAQLDRVKPVGWDIIEYVFIDDGSTDHGFEELKSLRTQAKRNMVLLRFRKNLGKSAALSIGFSHAKGEYLVTLDADLQDEPAEIPQLLERLKAESDLVIGWRTNRRDSFIKRLSSRLFNSVVSRAYGVKLHDMNSGLKVCTRDVANEIHLYGELHRYFPVLAAARGFRVSEVPVTHHARRYGKSKFNNGRIIHAFFDLTSTLFITSFEHQPMQVFGTAGGVSILIGIGILTYLTVLHFMGQSIIRRPLLFAGMMFVLFGMQMVSTGLIGELIVHKRHDPVAYPIAEIVK